MALVKSPNIRGCQRGDAPGGAYYVLVVTGGMKRMKRSKRIKRTGWDYLYLSVLSGVRGSINLISISISINFNQTTFLFGLDVENPSTPQPLEPPEPSTLSFLLLDSEKE